MDTNQNVANNYQINSFTKGMNTDTAYDQVNSEQYIFGLNIRITNNALLTDNINAENKEQVVTPIMSGKPLTAIENISQNARILAAESIENTGCIIINDSVAGSEQPWKLYKAVYNPNADTISYTLIYTSTNNVSVDVKRFSVTMIKETEGVIKAYIADTINPVMSVFLENNEITGNISDFYLGQQDRDLCSGQIFPYKKPTLSKISGNLKTQLVQYAYRFYRRYGVSSKLSPLTNKIQIVGSNRKIEPGMAEDTVTDVGINVTVPIDSSQRKLFNYVQIFRISFIKCGELPDVNLICDKKIQTSGDFVFGDTGVESLAQYSLDEFSALQTQTIVPRSIEQNQNYLFAANVKDETLIDVSELTGFNAVARIAYCDVDIDNMYYDLLPEVTTSFNSSTLKIKCEYQIESQDHVDDYSISDYFEDCGIDSTIEKLSYSDIFISSLFRSLRRDEQYDYGIVYYDKYGNHSSVQQLSSVNTDTTSPFSTAGKARSLGILVSIEVPQNYSGNIIGFQVVRRDKSFDHTKNIILVALSRPMRQGKFDSPTYRTPYYPNTFLSSQFFYTIYNNDISSISASRITGGNSRILSKTLWSTSSNVSNYMYFDNSGTNVENTSLYLIFSPEINLERNNVLSRISSSNTKILPINYLYENRPLGESTVSMADKNSPDINTDTVKYRYVAGTETDDSTTAFSDLLYGQQTIEYTTTLANVDEEGDTLTFDGYKILDERASSTKLYLYIPSHMDFQFLFLTYQGVLWAGYWLDPSTAGAPYTYVLENQNTSRTINGVQYDTYKVNGSVGDTMLINPISQYRSYNVLYDYYGQTMSITNPGVSGTFVYTSELNTTSGNVFTTDNHVYLIAKAKENYNKGEKVSQNSIIKLDSKKELVGATSVAILNVSDVKNPNWENGFSNVTLKDGYPDSAISQYKSYLNQIGTDSYNNWASNGMYNMAPTKTEADNQLGNRNRSWRCYVYNIENQERFKDSMGWIGPGPVCLLINTQTPEQNHILTKQIDATDNGTYFLGTIVANISHDVTPYTNLSPYYGFGNFFLFDTQISNNVTSVVDTTKYVFDGEIYPMFAEFVNLFKTYDFNDKFATIPSGQVVYYIPLESKINTYFDYGCNYRNTLSANLMLEPGQISGVSSQDRPLHLYNMIYSDNDNSIDVYYVESEKKPQVSFPLRIFYSLYKTNGENIDNYLIFKPADFIDADSRYGDVTDLLSVDTNIYFWQTGAFGKLSINERSLITDNNGETILLGQGGVLLRTDYISTKYGMRRYDQSSINTESAICWIDILNKAILMYNQNVANYGEVLNVLNLINKEIDTQNLPTIAYDIQNNELLCGCLNNCQLVFNTKYNIATSVYTRQYKDTICFSNVLCGLNVVGTTQNNQTTYSISASKYNFLQKPGVGEQIMLEAPTVLKFVVNSAPYQTKVFDNQKVVITGKQFEQIDSEELLPNYLKKELSKLITNYIQITNGIPSKTYSFTTDIKSTTEYPMFRTDREGNIIYDIPRTTSSAYGDRLRGKWMVEQITDNDPKIDYCISHIITKFRQSYS